MTLKVDLHVHSDLSPCAEPEMTPADIVGMAMVNGLDAIALTDHQSCANCGPAMRIAAAMNGPLVLAGLEVESAEEVHLLCLFADLKAAERLQSEVRAAMPAIDNRPDIFGSQNLYDDDNEIRGQETLLLMQACGLSCDRIARRTLDLGGVCLPAHVDRQANGMIAHLGGIPPDFPAAWLEISASCDRGTFRINHHELDGYRLIVGSDAHRLADLALAGYPLKVGRQGDAAAIVAALRQGRPNRPRIVGGGEHA